MPAPLLATSCHNHPDRPALAICVSCHEAVCQSCSTLWEGMHHCVDCLAARRTGASSRGAWVATLAVSALSAGLLFAITHLRALVATLLAVKLS